MLGYPSYGSHREHATRNAKRYTSKDIAHAWAHQESKDGRCPASMSFEGRKFYSYATCIAELIDYNGQRVVLVNRTSYSSTTAQHQYDVRSAVRSLGSSVKVFEIEGIDTGTSSLADLPAILRGFQKRAEERLAEPAQREIKRSRLIVEAYEIVVQMRDFAEFFGLDLADYKVTLPIPSKVVAGEEVYTRIIGLRLGNPSPWLDEAPAPAESYLSDSPDSPFDVLVKTRPSTGAITIAA